MLNADITSAEGVPKMLYPDEEKRIIISKVTIPLGPFGTSDFIEIFANDIGEVCVLHGTPGSVECVLSVLPEEL